MIDYLRRSRCRDLWPLSKLENGLCPDCWFSRWDEWETEND